MTLYGADLARVQIAGFGDFARRAAPEIVALLGDAPICVRRVVDVGCGAGITTRALTDAGFEVVAIEPSLHLLEAARAAAPSATFVHGGAYDATIGPCEAVLAVGEPLTYHAPGDDAEARVRGFFADVAAALPPGGRLVFDVISADGPSLDDRSFRSEDGWAILYETREDREGGRLTRTAETFVREGTLYRRAREVHHVRLFREAELSAWLDDASFDVAIGSSYGAVELAPRRLACVATRR